MITYVPADGDRSLKRGHQPAAELARGLAAHWALDAVPLLERTRPVARQAGLTLHERRGNVRGAFVARADVAARHAPGEVVLVDDVYTTGATATAAASALRVAGVRRVHVVTFARAVR